MPSHPTLPPGQRETADFPRFGWAAFAFRFPTQTARAEIEIRSDSGEMLVVHEDLAKLPRVEQVSDLHCVTTWTKRSLRWGGYRFRDFVKIALGGAEPSPEAGTVILRGQDGFAARIPLSDLLQPDVLLADQLDGRPLPLEHGAPIRIVAPAHYGYKNVKHLKTVEFLPDTRGYRFAGPSFMDHPRARVDFEERGNAPAWLLRNIYPLLVPPVRWLFRTALQRHQRKSRARKERSGA